MKKKGDFLKSRVEELLRLRGPCMGLAKYKNDCGNTSQRPGLEER